MGFEIMTPVVKANFVYIGLIVAGLLCETTGKEVLVNSRGFVQSVNEDKARQLFVA
jgi:hypothetical protein